MLQTFKRLVVVLKLDFSHVWYRKLILRLRVFRLLFAQERFSNDPLRRIHEVSKKQMSYDGLVEFSSMSLDCDSSPSLAGVRGTKISDLSVSLATSKHNFKLLKRQITSIWKEMSPIAFERGMCNTTEDCIWASWCGYRDECNHVAERLADGKLSLEMSCMAAAIKTKVKVSHFLCSLVLFIKHFISHHIARARSSGSRQSSAVLASLSSAKNKLECFVSSHPATEDSLVDDIRVVPYRAFSFALLNLNCARWWAISCASFRWNSSRKLVKFKKALKTST